MSSIFMVDLFRLSIAQHFDVVGPQSGVAAGAVWFWGIKYD